MIGCESDSRCSRCFLGIQLGTRLICNLVSPELIADRHVKSSRRGAVAECAEVFTSAASTTPEEGDDTHLGGIQLSPHPWRGCHPGTRHLWSICGRECFRTTNCMAESQAIVLRAEFETDDAATSGVLSQSSCALHRGIDVNDAI